MSKEEIKGVYHLKLLAENIAKDIFLVGDQGRVSEISKRFDSIECQISNREFTTHTGFIGKNRVSVLSTGIGTDNIDIVMNELDAIAPQNESFNLIRLGTSGTLQKEIDINSLVVSTHGLGIDNLMHFYANNQFDAELQKAITEQLHWPKELSTPYIYAANKELLSKFEDLQSGITVTAPGFYAPQGRKIRLPFAIEDMHDRLKSFNYNGLKITNFEMETSALYGLSTLLGHKSLTVCTILANRATGKTSNDYKSAIDNMIETVLTKLY